MNDTDSDGLQAELRHLLILSHKIYSSVRIRSPMTEFSITAHRYSTHLNNAGKNNKHDRSLLKQIIQGMDYHVIQQVKENCNVHVNIQQL